MMPILRLGELFNHVLSETRFFLLFELFTSSSHLFAARLNNWSDLICVITTVIRLAIAEVFVGFRQVFARIDVLRRSLISSRGSN